MYNNEVDPDVVQGIYKQAADDLLTKIKIALGLEEEKPSYAPDAATYTTMGVAAPVGALLGGSVGKRIGSSLGENAALVELGNRVRNNGLAAFGGHPVQGKALADRTMQGLDTRNWVGKALPASRIKQYRQYRNGAAMYLPKSKIERLADTARVRGAQSGARRGRAVGAGIGTLAAVAAAYAANNPRTRDAIARMVG